MNIDNYAENMAKSVNEAIKKAFQTGFQYAMSINLNDEEFVDLGLPSGTKWAKSYLGVTDITPEGVYCSFDESQKYSIPTEEQVNELQNKCVVRKDEDNSTRIIGPNGRELLLQKSNVWNIILNREKSLMEKDYQGIVMAVWVKYNNEGKPKIMNINDNPYIGRNIELSEAELQKYRYHVLLVKTGNNI